MAKNTKADHGSERRSVKTNGRASDILDPNNQIGVKLRSLYASVQDEAIPDRFLSLLEQLDQAERQGRPVSSGSGAEARTGSMDKVSE